MIDEAGGPSYHLPVQKAVRLTLEDIRRTLRPSLEQCGVEKAIVFGSHARETQSQRSDVDLLLVVKTDERYFKRYDRIADVYRALPSAELDVLIYTPEELERNADRPFVRRVLQEGKLIYERGKEQA